MTPYIAYWKFANAKYTDDSDGGLLFHAASNQYSKVRKGDTVWIVTSNDGTFYLLGPIVVHEIVSTKEVERRFKRTDFFDATHHILAAKSKEVRMKWIDVTKVLPKLRFEGTERDRLPAGWSARNLQTMRKLSLSSHELLEKTYVDADSAEGGGTTRFHANLPGLRLCYRPDKDLDFLRLCRHEDLQHLAEVLTTSKGSRRISEFLTKDRRYAENRNNLTKVWELVAAELQRFGADTFVSLVRGGKGVLYREILEEVAKRCSVKLGKGETTADLEDRVVATLLEQALKKMSKKDVEIFFSDIQKELSPEEAARFAEHLRKGLDPKRWAAAGVGPLLQAAIRQGGFLSYKLTVVAANAVAQALVGRGLGMAANQAMVRYLALFAGPVGWVVNALLAVPIITGPAFRVTLPAVLVVASLRKKLMNDDPL